MIEVRAPAAAAVFADARRRRLLLYFVGEGRSLAEVARAGDAAIGYLHYHARRWLALGLLEVIEERRRPGRAVKIYRATGDSFFVPDSCLAGPTNSGLIDELYRGFDRVRGDDDAAGTLFTAEGGKPRMSRIDSRPLHHSTEIWRILQLDDRAAAALVSELERIAQPVGPKSTGRSRPYLLHLALAPRPRN